MAVYTQIIADAPNRLALKRVNTGDAESAVMMVQGSALKYSLRVMTTDASAERFHVGETVVSGANAGQAIVQDVVNATTVILSDVTGTWANDADAVGETSAATRKQDGALVEVPRSLTVRRLAYNVSGNTMTLIWQNTANTNNQHLAVVSGEGSFAFDQMGAGVVDPTTGKLGNILITVPASTTYTLVLDIGKTAGYAAPNIARNPV